MLSWNPHHICFIATDTLRSQWRHKNFQASNRMNTMFRTQMKLARRGKIKRGIAKFFTLHQFWKRVSIFPNTFHLEIIDASKLVSALISKLYVPMFWSSERIFQTSNKNIKTSSSRKSKIEKSLNKRSCPWIIRQNVYKGLSTKDQRKTHWQIKSEKQCINCWNLIFGIWQAYLLVSRRTEYRCQSIVKKSTSYTLHLHGIF